MYQRHIIVIAMLFWSVILGAQEVVIVVPVQDLFSEKLSLYGPKDAQELYDYYNKYPSWSGYEKKFDCLRTGQALFNDKGHIIDFDETTGEMCIQFDNMLVEKSGTLEPCKFWLLSYKYETSRKGVCKISTVITLDEQSRAQNNVDDAVFPICLKSDAITTLRHRNCIILIKPYFDSVTQQTYSAGTRFIRFAQNDTPQNFSIRLFDIHTGREVVTMVPHTHARQCDEDLNSKERRKLFNELLQTWCCCGDNKIIPYVWGGQSIKNPIEDEGFELITSNFFDKKVRYYVRKNSECLCGCDCSSLILLAARIAGIDYWFKTTSTALRYGKPVERFEDIQSGDLVVWNGHVVVIAGNDSCIESLGYGAGAGKVRKVPLIQKFKGITSVKDIWQALQKNWGLSVLFANSSVVAKEISEFKIITLFPAKP